MQFSNGIEMSATIGISAVCGPLAVPIQHQLCQRFQKQDPVIEECGAAAISASRICSLSLFFAGCLASIIGTVVLRLPTVLPDERAWISGLEGRAVAFSPQTA
jgi:hypothetical protein